MGSAFHQLCPRYSGTLTPTAPTAIRLWDTFTFTFLYISCIQHILFLINLRVTNFRVSFAVEYSILRRKLRLISLLFGTWGHLNNKAIMAWQTDLKIEICYPSAIKLIRDNKTIQMYYKWLYVKRLKFANRVDLDDLAHTERKTN